jgi:hypothetical protein
MPRPQFIICSESGAVDKYTNGISAYNILEVIELTSKQDTTSDFQRTWPVLAVRMVATWLRDEHETGQEFEYETRFQLPQECNWRTIASGKFVFKARHQRFLADITGPQVQEGILRVANAIRRTEPGSKWLIQEFEIVVERVDEPVA